MSTDFRALCAELLSRLEESDDYILKEEGTIALADRARAALAEPVGEGPTDEEITGLMPPQMHEDLAAAVRAMAEQEGIDSTPAKGVLRIMLNRHCVDLALAVLARYGHQPAPPAAGEVGELVAWLREAYDSLCKQNMHLPLLVRAADLLERQAAPVLEPALARINDILNDSGRILQTDELEALELARQALEQRQAAPVPVAVSDKLPEPGVKVLAHYFNDLGKGRTICAIWVPAKTRSDSYGDDGFTEYDEDSDTFYWPEGWYEAIENWDDLGYVKVDEGEVIYWQPLPQWPATALPLPSGEVEP